MNMLLQQTGLLLVGYGTEVSRMSKGGGVRSTEKGPTVLLGRSLPPLEHREVSFTQVSTSFLLHYAFPPPPKYTFSTCDSEILVAASRLGRRHHGFVALQPLRLLRLRLLSNSLVQYGSFKGSMSMGSAERFRRSILHGGKQLPTFQPHRGFRYRKYNIF